MKQKRVMHPGHILRQMIKEIDMSIGNFAKYIGTSHQNLNALINNRRAQQAGKVSIARFNAKIALKLADALGTTPEFWLELQNKYDIWLASKDHKKIKNYFR